MEAIKERKSGKVKTATVAEVNRMREEALLADANNNSSVDGGSLRRTKSTKSMKNKDGNVEEGAKGGAKPPQRRWSKMFRRASVGRRNSIRRLARQPSESTEDLNESYGDDGLPPPSAPKKEAKRSMFKKSKDKKTSKDKNESSAEEEIEYDENGLPKLHLSLDRMEPRPSPHDDYQG